MRQKKQFRAFVQICGLEESVDREGGDEKYGFYSGIRVVLEAMGLKEDYLDFIKANREKIIAPKNSRSKRRDELKKSGKYWERDYYYGAGAESLNAKVSDFFKILRTFEFNLKEWRECPRRLRFIREDAKNRWSWCDEEYNASPFMLEAISSYMVERVRDRWLGIFLKNGRPISPGAEIAGRLP